MIPRRKRGLAASEELRELLDQRGAAMAGRRVDDEWSWRASRDHGQVLVEMDDADIGHFGPTAVARVPQRDQHEEWRHSP